MDTEEIGSLDQWARLVRHMGDLESLYEEIESWLEDTLQDSPLIFYHPEPLEDLPHAQTKLAVPVLLRGELDLPDPLTIQRIRGNESGIVELSHYLLHFSADGTWLGAIEGPEPVNEIHQRAVEWVSEILELGSELEGLRNRSNLLEWVLELSRHLQDDDPESPFPERLLGMSSEILECEQLGYYVSAGGDFELKHAMGFSPEEHRSRRMISHQQLTEMGFLESRFMTQNVEDGDRINLFLPLQFGESFLGLMVGYEIPRPRDEFTAHEQNQLETLRVFASLMLSNLELSTRLQSKVLRDDLTDLKTEEYFRNRLQEEIQRGDRYGFSCTVLIFDIDKFERINEEYGRTAGDTVLREMGRIMRNNFRTIDISCRFEDDRFGVLLPHTEPRDALVAANRFHKLVSVPMFNVQGQDVSIEISGGLASYPEDGDDQEQLIKRASVALYEAKQTGRDRIVTSQHLEESMEESTESD